MANINSILSIDQQRIDIAEQLDFLEKEKEKYQSAMEFLEPNVREKVYDFIETKMREDQHFVESMMKIYDSTSQSNPEERKKVLLKLKKDEKRSIQNFHNAFDWLRNEIKSKKSIEPWTLLMIHSKIAEGFSDINPGHYREISHARPIVGGMIAPAIESLGGGIAQHVENIIKYINLKQAPASERAFEAIYNLVILQPFLDRNKRTSLLFANLILMKEGYPPLFLDASNKDECVYAIKDYRDTGSPKKFYNFMFREYKNSIKQVSDYLTKAVQESTRVKNAQLAQKIARQY